MGSLGIISLLVYIAVILLINTIFKRKMDECMVWAFLVLTLITAVFKGDVATAVGDALGFAFKQEVVFAATAFSFMAYLMQTTGVINRLVNILNSFLGRLRGGAAYVSTIASALFGMISGSGSGNAAAVGSITIPWMKQTGWSDNLATSIVAGNAGLGIVFPPSSSMFLLLGMPAIAAEITSAGLYTTLLSGAFIILAYRLLLMYYYVRKYKIPAMEKSQIPSFKSAFKEGWSSLLIFLGVMIPLIVTTGKLSEYLKEAASFGADALKSISLIVWIPILIIAITFLEGWKYMPKTGKGWFEFLRNAVPHFATTGVLLFFAFAASRLLINLGLEEEVTSLFGTLGGYSKLIVVLALSVLSIMMVGPFTGTATTTAIGSVGYLALRSIGVAPGVACTVLLILFSNEGCIPPNSAPVYIASGIADLDDPAKTFPKLIFHFALPTVLLAVLMAMGIIPLYIGG